MTQQIHGYRGWKGTKASGAAVIAIAATVLLWFGKIDADAWTTALFIAAGLLGAGDVRGSSAHWGTIGFRWEMKPGVSLGTSYSHALRRESNNDIFKSRFLSNIVVTF